jgi:hypothetical protein
MLYQNPAIRSRVEVYLVEEAKGGPSKLLLSFLFINVIRVKAVVVNLSSSTCSINYVCSEVV